MAERVAAPANYHANALARGLTMLERLAGQGRAQTLADLGRSTGLPEGTMLRLLQVLDELGYVVRVDGRPSYRLGHKVLPLANAYSSSLDLATLVGRHLEPLAEATRHTANLGVLDGDEVLHVCVCEPDRPLRFTAPLGARDHAYCTGLGKMLLAALEPSALEACLPPEPYGRFTDATITELAPLRADLERSRRRGWSLDDNERSEGLRCVAVPVAFGARPAAVSVSGPAAEFTEKAQARYVQLLTDAAAALVQDVDVVAAVEALHLSLRPPGRAPAATPAGEPAARGSGHTS